MAPSDAHELRRMVATAAAYDDGPIAFRYPRGDIHGEDTKNDVNILEIGKGRIIEEGKEIALVGLGSRVSACIGAASLLREHGLHVTIADARFAKPIDTDLIERLVKSHRVVMLVEEGSIGGFSAQVLTHLAQARLLDRAEIDPMILPDRFIAHGSPAEQLADAGLDAQSIAARVIERHRTAARKVA
jgi:1-deoxy-D-xylulose-5-phosphate synthase